MDEHRASKIRIAYVARLVFSACALFVFFVGVVVLVASASRAKSVAVQHEHGSHSSRVERTPRSVASALPDELAVLSRVHADEHTRLAANADWLPRTSHADTLPPVQLDASTRRRHANHQLDLRDSSRAERISHDTYYLGAHRQQTADPHAPLLHGYAFVHYHGHSKRARVKTRRESEDRAKYVHFNRSTDEASVDQPTDVDKHQQTLHQLLLSSHASAAKQRDVSPTWRQLKCAAPIRHGARMRHSSGYVLHTDNNSGLSARQVVDAVETGIDAWRCVFAALNVEPLGPLSGVVEQATEPIVFDRPTGQNHIGFGKLHMPDGTEDETLGVTVSFGTFNADRPSDRYLAEFKTLYNDAYTWANCADSHSDCERTGAIDLQSIAVHEMGHAFGLDDLYASECSQATMYWSSPPGDTSKRSLEADDIGGMRLLYASD